MLEAVSNELPDALGAGPVGRSTDYAAGARLSAQPIDAAQLRLHAGTLWDATKRDSAVTNPYLARGERWPELADRFRVLIWDGRRFVRDFTTRIDSRKPIEPTKGVLIVLRCCRADGTFEQLHTTSHRTNTTAPEHAMRLIDKAAAPRAARTWRRR